jgi:tetratricopeptide (TPR) repeat protein
VQQIGGYQLVEAIARGAFGMVFRGREVASGRPAAVKLLLPGASPRSRKRFEREAQAMLALDHPHVVRALGAGVENGHPYLALELLEGSSLQELLVREGALPFGRAAELIAQLARGVEHAHLAGVVHRDLKPANVLLDGQGRPKLTDFGLVREVDPRLSQTRLSQTGMCMGTPGYWAPEQAAGELDRIGPTTDVYGLGGLLFALLTGRPPKLASNLIAVLARLDDPPPRPSSIRPGVPRVLERLCLRCLERDPSARPASAAEVADALEAFLDGEATAPSKLGPRVAAAVLVAGLAAAAGVLAWSSRGSTATASSPPTAAASPTAGAVSPLASPPPAPAPADMTPLDAWTHGRTLHDAGWVEAAARMRARLEADPGDVRAWAVLGLAHSYLGRAGDAEEAFAAAEAGETDAVVRALRGESLLKVDRPRGLTLLREALVLDGECLPALLLLIEPAAAEMDFNRLDELLERATALAPDNPQVDYMRGQFNRELEVRLEHFDRALERAPRFLAALLARARLRLQAGRHADARADVTLALELDSENLRGHELRGAVRLIAGDRDGWLSDMRVAVTSSSASLRRRVYQSLLEEALLREELGESHSALEVLRALRELQRGDPGVNALWAWGEIRAGNAASAIRLLNERGAVPGGARAAGQPVDRRPRRRHARPARVGLQGRRPTRARA